MKIDVTKALLVLSPFIAFIAMFVIGFMPSYVFATLWILFTGFCTIAGFIMLFKMLVTHSPPSTSNFKYPQDDSAINKLNQEYKHRNMQDGKY